MSAAKRSTAQLSTAQLSTAQPPLSLQHLASWGFSALVQRETLKDQLLKDRPALTPEQQEQAVPLLFRHLKLTTEAAVQRWLLAEGVSQQDLQVRAERQLRWQLLCEQRFKSQVSTLFLKRKSQLDQAVYSLIWVDDEAMAQELFLQLSERENSFEQLWCTLPDSPDQLPTGKVGPVPLGDLPEALAELLRVSTPGHIWPPRAAEGGWVLLRLDELQPAVFNQGHRSELALELGDQWLRDQIARSAAAQSS